MNNITGTTGSALDRLHPDRPGRIPRFGTDGDRITCAAVALVSFMRVAGNEEFTDVNIHPRTGQLSIVVTDLHVAAGIASGLGLPAGRETEIDGGVVLTSWRGDWEDWPVVISHYAIPRSATRGADVLAVVTP